MSIDSNSGQPIQKPLQSTSLITEKDLLRQIASNLTKEQISKGKQSFENSDEAKNLFVLNLQQCSKVWQAFEKFINDQVCNKSRLVDTQLAGIFFKLSTQSHVQFMPSPDYLDAGRFKIQRSATAQKFAGSEVENINLAKTFYKESYEQILSETKRSDLTVLSHASIGAVTNLNKDQVQRILTDFFQAIIELSRRTIKEARIRVGGCGYIVLHKNRELGFQPNLSDATNEEIAAHRSIIRDDISIIDGASAVLSLGGGKAFSVRSSKISKASLLTPVTNLSVTTSVFESRKSEIASTNHSSPKSVRQSYGSARKMYESENKKLQESTTESKVRGSIPFPYLQGFINDQAAAQVSKRVVFDYSGYDDIKGSLQQQIEQKNQTKHQERISEFQNHLAETTRWRQKLYEEQQNLARDRISKQRAFAIANQELIKQREIARQQNKNLAKMERLNFFPFTHGDLIERNKTILTQLQQQELVQAILTNQERKETEKRNRIKNQISASQVPVVGKVPIEGVKVSNNNVVGGVESSRFFPDRGSRQFMVKTMDAAIDRFTDNLKRIEQEKILQHEDFKWRIQAEKDIEEADKNRKKQMQAKFYLDLVSQIEANRRKEQDDLAQSKLQLLTNGGPSVDDEVVQEFNQLNQAQKQQTKYELLNQMQQIENSRLQKEFIELQNDQAAAEEAQERFNNENQMSLENDKITKLRNQKIWEMQKKLREETEQVEKMF